MPRPEVFRRFSGVSGSPTEAGSKPDPSSRIEITRVSATMSISRWTFLEGSCRLPCLMALASASRSPMRIQWRVSSGTSRPSRSCEQRCCAISMFSKRLESDIRIGPALSEGRNTLIHDFWSPADLSRLPKEGGTVGMLPSDVLQKRRIRAGGIAISAALLLGFTDLLPDRVAEFSRRVEDVRGRNFSRTVPASEIDKAELKRILRVKLGEELPVPA